MSADDHRKGKAVCGRHACWKYPDNEPLPHAVSEDTARGGSHRDRSLSCGDQPHGLGGNTARRERQLNEAAGIDRGYSSPGNRQEIESKAIERTSQ
jgi:hypothetical protein